jgi:hypothetical protein
LIDRIDRGSRRWLKPAAQGNEYANPWGRLQSAAGFSPPGPSTDTSMCRVVNRAATVRERFSIDRIDRGNPRGLKPAAG